MPSIAQKVDYPCEKHIENGRFVVACILPVYRVDQSLDRTVAIMKIRFIEKKELKMTFITHSRWPNTSSFQCTVILYHSFIKTGSFVKTSLPKLISPM